VTIRLGLMMIALFALTGEARQAVADTSSGQVAPEVVYVATPSDVVARMLRLANVTEDDVVYDLGCGDGRIVVRAARQYGARGVGYDINPLRVAESLRNVRRNQVESLVTIERRDIFTVDLSPATVVTLYLLPEMNERLIPQLKELQPGSRIVAHDYEIPGVAPDRTLTMISKVDEVPHYLYLYITPLRLDEEAFEEEF